MLRSRFILMVTILILLVSLSCGGPDIGITDDEIRVGTWSPLTGPAKDVSVMSQAMGAYFKYVNDEGGIHGRKLKLSVKDDGYDPSRTPEVVKELIEGEKVFAILGGTGTASCFSVKEYIQTKMLPWINPGSAARVWTTPMHAYVFSTFPTYVSEGQILARHVTENLEAKKFGIVYQDDSFGREGQEGVSIGLRRGEKKLDLVLPYKVGDNELSEVAQQFKDNEIDVIFIWTIPQGAAALVNAVNVLEDYDPQFVASQVLADPAMFELAQNAWEGAIVSSSVPDLNSNAPGVIKAKDILTKYGEGLELGVYTFWGLARAEIFVEGLRRAGPELNRLVFIKALESIDSWSENILGEPISFSDENHQGFSSVQLNEVEGGKLVPITDWLES